MKSNFSWSRTNFVTRLLYRFLNGCIIQLLAASLRRMMNKIINDAIFKNISTIYLQQLTTVKPLNSGHLRVFKNLSVIESWPLLGGNFKKIVTFGTKRFVRYSWHVRYLRFPLLGVFNVRAKPSLSTNSVK